VLIIDAFGALQLDNARIAKAEIKIGFIDFIVVCILELFVFIKI
jgi:hypothetical protein